jgi:putative addiction module component (TIGR02574 family)
MQTELLESAVELPLPERVELAEALWESVVAEGYVPPLTGAQSEELDRRLAAHRANPGDVVPASEVFGQLRERISKGK